MRERTRRAGRRERAESAVMGEKFPILGYAEPVECPRTRASRRRLPCYHLGARSWRHGSPGQLSPTFLNCIAGRRSVSPSKNASDTTGAPPSSSRQHPGMRFPPLKT